MFLHLECGFCDCKGLVPLLKDITPDNDAVLEEQNIINEQRRKGLMDPNIAVQICGLTKTYPWTININSCKCKYTSPYHAIKVLTLFYQGIQ